MKRFPAIFLLFTPVVVWAATSGESESMAARMMLLVLQLGILLLATRLGNLFFERLHMPGVLGELAGGMLVGPHCLGGLSLPSFSEGLFPLVGGAAVSPELYGFCSVAAIILLFMVGLETDLSLFLRYSVAGSAVGIGGVVVSFVAGDLTAVALSDFVFGAPMGFFDGPPLFLGVVATATSVGITARILSESNSLGSPEGVTILSGAVVDDVCGIVLLTVIIGLTQAHGEDGSISWGHVALVGGKAVGVWLVASVVGILGAPRLGRWLKQFRNHSSIAVMALSLTLILAVLFEKAGLAMIIGAYVMGLSLSRTDVSQIIREQVEPIYAFLVPLFFGVMGMHVDISAVSTPKMAIFAAAYTLATFVAKFVGAGVPSLLFGFNLRGAFRIGTGMIPRGEVTLIIAGIGLGAGVLSHEMFGMVVVMTAVTTIMAPPLLSALLRRPGSGRRHPESEQDSNKPIVYNFPSANTAEWVFSRLQQIFHNEGFFVHHFESEAGLMQARREESVINFRLEADQLEAQCRKSDHTFVNVAILEVLGDLQNAVKGLSKPVKAAQFAPQVRYDQPDAGEVSEILNYVRPKLLVPRLSSETKTELIRELLAVLVKQNLVRDPDIALRDLLRREEQMSTAMQHGVAIPHARTTAVDSLCCAVGLLPDGIDFEALDGQPSRIFVLTLSPLDQPTPHLQFMALLSRVLTPELCTNLLGSSTANEMLKTLSETS